MSDATHSSPAMTSNRPYLLRAIHAWIEDNGMTPYLLVDGTQQGVRVPPQTIKEGRVVLNIAYRAVSGLDMGNESIRFLARFSGVSQSIDVPVTAILAIYAQETGQGMMLPPDDPEHTAPSTEVNSTELPGDDEPPKKGPWLRVVK
ncbi:MAG TPA: ClpXP protease specificity-enhancing factor [Aquimonas sp.]|nr:ClpXP protease specificity-enhancing factor [Aquimonas sp.]HRF53603.1 ClpXP protease specificity-enhancing factor [Aquimonas sp.]